jgi:hypothetical protein
VLLPAAIVASTKLTPVVVPRQGDQSTTYCAVLVAAAVDASHVGSSGGADSMRTVRVAITDDCGSSRWYCALTEKARGMRPIGHPDFQYTPWSPERRAAASKAARARAKAAEAKSVGKKTKKKAAPRSKPKVP